MLKTFNAEAIGIRGRSLENNIALAAATGFAGIDFSIREAHALVEAHSLDYLRELFERHKVRPGQWGLPVVGEQSEWVVDLTQLHQFAALGSALDCVRCATWCPSWSDSREFAQNFEHHVGQLGPVAQVLADHGCRLGLEFLGPKTLQDGHRYPFIRTMGDMLELASGIGTGNVGLLLDAWHLYTSGGTLAELGRLRVGDVIDVHISDAPAGLPLEAQIDNIRCLPLETGVIDLVGFMRGLQAIGYDGPVTTEPFNARLNAIAANDPQAAAAEVSAAMDRLWEMSGV